MIIKIDKNKIVEHYRAKFAECLESEDFEGAIDCLFKFHEETDDPDFHMALGMLYLQMTAQSDDPELFTMAFREFLLHLRRHPDCSAAYRNMLATVFLYHEPQPMLECGKWVLSCGQNLDDILCELDEAGIDYFDIPDYSFMNLADLFKAGEYGAIDSGRSIRNVNDKNSQAPDADGEKTSKPDDCERGSKIIPFGGSNDGTAATADKQKSKRTKKLAEETDGVSKVLRPKFGGAKSDIYDFFNDLIGKYESDVGESVDRPEELLDRLLEKLDIDEADDDDSPITAEEFEKMLSEERDEYELPIQAFSKEGFRDIKAEDEIHSHIMRAEQFHSEGQIRAAISELDKIDLDKTEDFGYSVSVMLGYFCTDCGDYARAERELNRALAVRPRGALASTALCRLYETINKTELIPPILRKTDVKDFMDGAHVFKAFMYALKYCEPDDAAVIAKNLIDEYNIMDMRRMYAQMMYNRGEREYAKTELYKLARIFYDDINARYFYLLSRMNVKSMPVDEVAPQEIMGSIVQGLMEVTAHSRDLLVKLLRDDDLFRLGLEFFLSLEFSNERKLLCKMFETVRLLTNIPETQEIMRDALVSPYVEPIVKAVIIAELYAQEHDQTFLTEVSYCPWTFKGDPLGKEYSQGYYSAYAAFIMLKRTRHEFAEFHNAAEYVRTHTAGLLCSQSAIAYYVFKHAWNSVKHIGEPDDRLCYAFGFNSKTEANKAYKQIDNYINGKK